MSISRDFEKKFVPQLYEGRVSSKVRNQMKDLFLIFLPKGKEFFFCSRRLVVLCHFHRTYHKIFRELRT